MPVWAGDAAAHPVVADILARFHGDVAGVHQMKRGPWAHWFVRLPRTIGTDFVRLKRTVDRTLPRP